MSDLAGWRPRPLPERIALEGRYARLEPLDPARHGDGLFAALMGADAEPGHRYLFEAPMARPEFQAWLEAKAQRTDIVTHVVVDRATGAIGGRQDFMRMDPAHGVIEIGSIHWGKAIAGTRVATDALFLAARHVFDDLGYRRFEWKCHNANLPSKRAARRFGFAFEGIFRRHMVAKGRNRDTAWFAMIEEEWPALKAGYEAWLDPANFDGEGRQRSGLAACIDWARAARPVTPPPGFRRAEAADEPALVDLQQAAYQHNRAIIGGTPIPLEWDYAAVLRECEVWVKPGTGALVAALILRLRPHDLYLESVSVLPGAQGAGLARQMLAFTEQRAAALGREAVRLLTNIKLVRNVDWYLAKGYAIERIERLGERDIAHFRKDLRRS